MGMTPDKSIEIIKNMNFCGLCTTGNCSESGRKITKDEVIRALEEIQQYRAIGTPEECRAAAEKQKEKKPPVVNRPSIFVKVPVCPNCSTPEHYQPLYGKTKYCSNCGQRLDWSDEE